MMPIGHAVAHNRQTGTQTHLLYRRGSPNNPVSPKQKRNMSRGQKGFFALRSKNKNKKHILDGCDRPHLLVSPVEPEQLGQLLDRFRQLELLVISGTRTAACPMSGGNRITTKETDLSARLFTLAWPPSRSYEKARSGFKSGQVGTSLIGRIPPTKKHRKKWGGGGGHDGACHSRQ